MSIDLVVGFREKPTDLKDTAAAMGFSLDMVKPEDATFPVRMESYVYYDKARSQRGVWITYHAGTYSDHAEVWKDIIQDPSEIVASAYVTTYMGRNRFDFQKQKETARFLRDHYGGVLFDPQTGEQVTD